jgi:hypothetical protein
VAYKVSSEDGWDLFQVLVDASVEVEDSGEVDCTVVTVDVTGASTVTVRYTKYSSGSDGDDCAWIDALSFGGIGVIQEVVHLLGSGVESVVDASSAALAAAREWEPGTPKLKIINELLGAVGYESLSFDEMGRAVVRSYTLPSARAAEFVYADGELSVTHPEMADTLDWYDTPNRWTLVVSQPDQPVITSTYTNTAPSSPTSTVSRGREIMDYRTDVEAADQATLDAKVARLAFEASQVYHKIEFSTAVMPVHSGNDVYSIRSRPLALDSTYVETSWVMPLKAGGVMRHQARRVVTI